MDPDLSQAHGTSPESDLPVTANFLHRLVSGQVLPPTLRVAKALSDRDSENTDLATGLLQVVEQNVSLFGDKLGESGSLSSFAQGLALLTRSYFETHASLAFDMVSIPEDEWHQFLEITSDRIGTALVADLYR